LKRGLTKWGLREKKLNKIRKRNEDWKMSGGGLEAKGEKKGVRALLRKLVVLEEGTNKGKKGKGETTLKK